MKRNKFLLNSILATVLFLTASCNNSNNEQKSNNDSQSNKKNFEIITQKRFGISDLYFCLVPESNVDEMRNITESLTANSKVAFVYFYTDKAKIKDISGATDLLTALPENGYVAKFDKSPGEGIKFEKPSPPTITENNQAATAKPLGAVKIKQLEKKVRKGKYIWYTYYVENYIDNQETENKEIEVAKKLPFESSGVTEIFFFNDKENAPKLANDGGWGNNESQNSWNAKYGKYCVGYYSVGAGDNGTFSKGWN